MYIHTYTYIRVDLDEMTTLYFHFANYLRAIFYTPMLLNVFLIYFSSAFTYYFLFCSLIINTQTHMLFLQCLCGETQNPFFMPFAFSFSCGRHRLFHVKKYYIPFNSNTVSLNIVFILTT